MSLIDDIANAVWNAPERTLDPRTPVTGSDVYADAVWAYYRRTLDLITPALKLLGKMIAMRRMADHESLHSGSLYNYDDFLAHTSAQVAKVGYGAFTDTWLPKFIAVKQLVQQFENFALQVDNAIISHIQQNIVPVIGMSRTAPLTTQLEAVVAYMRTNNMIVPSGDPGLYTYFINMFKDHLGQPLQLPASPSGVYSVGWATSDIT